MINSPLIYPRENGLMDYENNWIAENDEKLCIEINILINNERKTFIPVKTSAISICGSKNTEYRIERIKLVK